MVSDQQPTGFYEHYSPSFMTDDLYSFTSDEAFFPYLTFYSSGDHGGLTIGNGIGDTGSSNFINLYAAAGSG